MKPRMDDRGQEASILLNELGTCCVCGASGDVHELVMLDGESPLRGRGWGCVVCDLPEDGAVAVICTRCSEGYHVGVAVLKYICRGHPRTDGRVPFEQMQGSHAHNLDKHVDRNGGF